MDSNDRRNEWLSRQYAAEQANSLDTFVAEQTAKSRERHRQAAAFAAAKEAVVKAAMDMRPACFRLMETVGDHYMVVDRNGPEWAAFNAACAALAALEGK